MFARFCRLRPCPLLPARLLKSLLLSGAFAAGACQAQAIEQPHGFVYRVTAPKDGAAGTLILYGTLHVGRAHAELDAPTKQLLANANRLALELDPRDTEGVARAVQEYGLYPPDDSLDQHIPAALALSAQSHAKELKLPAEKIERLRPWMLATFLSTLNLSAAGFDPRAGSESLLADEAAKDGVHVTEIEGANVQFRLLASQPAATQTDALRLTLDELDNHHITDQAAQLLAAWQASDVKAVERMLAEIDAEPGLYAHFMAEQLLAQRDEAMLSVALQDLRAGGTTFFAVGTLHLFGPEGLLALLRKQGYQVTALSPVAG